MEMEELLRRAAQARQNAYAPYSHFQVGAALLTGEGRVYSGCNVESASFSPTCCAERVALFSAVARGERDFAAIAIVGWPEGEAPSAYVSPCGVCRQALAEFCDLERFQVVLGGGPSLPPRVYSLGELLPLAVTPGTMGQKEEKEELPCGCMT